MEPSSLSIFRDLLNLVKKNYIKDALESFLIYNFVADFRCHLLGGAVVLIRYDQESFKMEFIA